MGLATWLAAGFLSDEELTIFMAILFYFIIVPLSFYYLIFGEVIEYRIFFFGIVVISVIIGLYRMHKRNEEGK